MHEATVAVSRLLSEDTAAEEARLADAIDRLRTQIDAMLEGHEGVLGPSYDVLETYRMLAHSRSWNHSLAGCGAFWPHRRGGGGAGALGASRQSGPGPGPLPARAGA